MQQRKKKRKDDLDFYDYADLIFGTLVRRYIALFNRLKTLPIYNEQEVIQAVNEVYAELDRITRRYYLLLIRKIWNDLMDLLDLEDAIETVLALILDRVLNGYDPITKYVYVHEIDRKRARTIESLLASEDKTQEVETAKKQWSKQAKQYADNVVRETVITALTEYSKREGTKKVVWNTEEDLRVCAICEERDGKVYEIIDLPPPPHYGCRCWVTIWKDE